MIYTRSTPLYPAEVLADGDRVRLIRKRERYRDVVRTRDVKGG